MVIPPARLDVLPPSLQRHADLGICLADGRTAVCPPDSFDYYKEALSPYGFTIICGKNALSCNYPKDSAYNVCVAGKKCFLNKNVCDEVLYDILTSVGYEIIHIKQGYTKCSICPIDENSIITADAQIASIAKRCGMDVLEITNDSIVLPGYSNGFFGGSSGMGDKNSLLINGELSTHPDKDRILSFLQGKNIEVKELKKGNLTDIGSILPLITI